MAVSPNIGSIGSFAQSVRAAFGGFGGQSTGTSSYKLGGLGFRVEDSFDAQDGHAAADDAPRGIHPSWSLIQRIHCGKHLVCRTLCECVLLGTLPWQKVFEPCPVGSAGELGCRPVVPVLLGGVVPMMCWFTVQSRSVAQTQR